MTREQAKKWIKEITAFANGEAILAYSEAIGWGEVKEPLWNIKELYVINDKHVEARKAYAMGEKIECLDDGRWVDVHIPSWLHNCEYRAKPKWTPKQGEMIEVKLKYGTWTTREFLAMTKVNDRYICFDTSGDCTACWDLAREIKNV